MFWAFIYRPLQMLDYCFFLPSAYEWFTEIPPLDEAEVTSGTLFYQRIGNARRLFDRRAQ